MKHKILVVGVGSIGERHLRCFQNTGRADLAFVEVNESLRRDIAERYGIRQTYSDLDAAISDGATAAIVATPAHTHIPIATRLADAGIHLLIEKPLSTSLDGVDKLMRTVEQKNLIAAVAYVYRAHPVLAGMRRAIHSGRFGKPLEIIAVCGQNFPSLRPAYRTTYYANREQGGGAVQDALTHLVNAGEWLVGPITQVVADADHLQVAGVSVEDTVHVLTRHTARIMGTYTLNQHQAPNEVLMRVVCESGTVMWDLYKGCWSWMSEPGTNWNHEPRIVMERDTWFMSQAESFLNALDGSALVTCTLAEGVQTLKVNLAILKAAEERLDWHKID